jgi:hypothetical protein
MSRAVLVVAIVLSTVTSVRAGPEVALEIKISEVRGAAPYIVASVIGGPVGANASRWSLVQLDRNPPIEVPANELRNHRDSEDSIAIVVLVEGHFLFMADGIHRHVAAVIDAVRDLGPTGSLGAVVTYDKGATVRRSMTPLADLDHTALGVERDYRGRVTRDLVTGVEVSIDLLRRVVTSRKALIVVGDGADTDIENAKIELAEQRRICAQDRIELYSIAYDAHIGDELSAIKALIPDVRIALAPRDVEAHAAAIAERIAGRYQIVFPGRALEWVACKVHTFELRFDGVPIAEPFELGAPFPCLPRRREPPAWRAPLLTAIAVVAAAQIVLVFVRIWRRRQSTGSR